MISLVNGYTKWYAQIFVPCGRFDFSISCQKLLKVFISSKYELLRTNMKKNNLVEYFSERLYVFVRAWCFDLIYLGLLERNRRSRWTFFKCLLNSWNVDTYNIFSGSVISPWKLYHLEAKVRLARRSIRPKIFRAFQSYRNLLKWQRL